MSKYDKLKFLKETKARIIHSCDKCNKTINSGEFYFAEKIERVNVPGIRLKKFCKNCYQKFGDKLLL